jgi:hypothetical protein
MTLFSSSSRIRHQEGQRISQTEEVMKTPFSRSRFGVAMIARAACGAALLLGVPNPAFAQAMTLQGTWVVETQNRNCTTNAPMGTPHRALVSYHAGGTLSDSSSVPAFAVGQRSEGHGTWRHDGAHTYTANWVAMIQFDTVPGVPPTPPGAPGFLSGWQVAANTITLTGPDTFTSVGVSNFVNLSGEVYRVGCASRTAERFK